VKHRPGCGGQSLEKRQLLTMLRRNKMTHSGARKNKSRSRARYSVQKTLCNS
jgi:hypothetical protein